MLGEDPVPASSYQVPVSGDCPQKSQPFQKRGPKGERLDSLFEKKATCPPLKKIKPVQPFRNMGTFQKSTIKDKKHSAHLLETTRSRVNASATKPYLFMELVICFNLTELYKTKYYCLVQNYQSWAVEA